MVEIGLSYIYNSPNDEETLRAMVDEFGAQQRVKVNLRMMTWSNAWPEILTIATHGGDGSPDVSHIGGTWVSSLAKLNALRPFKINEIEGMGGAEAFMKPVWESTSLFDDKRVWSIPWTGWIYLVCYRKDLLEKVGVDVAKAFGTIQAFNETIGVLKNSNLEIPWLNPYIPSPHTDLLHTAASWVWAAGGDFIDSTGTQVAFDSPKSIEGLAMWLESYRAVPEMYKKFQMGDYVKLFSEGQAAAMLADIQQTNFLIDFSKEHQVRENLGISTLTNVPWVGGGNFVIWEHTRWNYERERAALELIRFLVSKESNLRWERNCGHMPARIDALEELYPPGNPLHEAMDLASHHGRAYHNIPLWRRIENQLALVLGAAVKEAHENPAVDSASILRKNLEPLARRLNVTLST